MKRLFWLGIMIFIMALTGQAWAAIVATPAYTQVAATNSTGSYYVLIKTSATPGASYILEESPDGVGSWVASDLGTLNKKLITGKTNGTYYYRGMAYRAGDTDSGYTPVVSTTVTMPTVTATPADISVPATTANGIYAVIIKTSTTPGCSYMLEEGPSATGPWTQSDLGLLNKKSFQGKAAGTYYYRGYAYKAGLTDSAYTVVKAITVAAPATVVATPASLSLPATTKDSFYFVMVKPSTTVGCSYTVEESLNGVDGWTGVYSGTLNKAYITGKTSGTYYYRAKATKAGMTDSSYTGVGSIVVAQTVGTAVCADCHNTTLISWNAGRHANTNNNPSGLGGCGTCHSPNKEVNASGNGVIGCESCHGVNLAHVDSGDGTPLFDLNTAINACFKCHTNHTDYATYNGQDGIGDKVSVSMHAFGGQRYSANCQRCHTIEGFLNLIDNSFNPSANANYTTPLILTAGSAPTCAACHDSHQTGLRTVPGWDPNQNTAADQFDLCTACHNLYNNDGSLVTTFYHQTTWYRNIQSTHYDNPATGVTGALDAVNGTNIIEGYVVRKDSANPCFDCHGHELRANTRKHLEFPVVTLDQGATTHTDWANSAHAGNLLANKVATGSVDPATGVITADPALVTAAGVVDAPVGNAWAHYNWDRSGRASCQHCHTATGAANYMDAARNEVAYVAANNDFSHLTGWTPATAADGSNQNELLYCWGCHSDAGTGALRLTGAFTLDYLVDGASKQLTAPDGKSGACLTCHSGRGNRNTLLGANPLDPANTTVIASPGTKTHYLAAGMSLYQAQLNTPYTYGLNYADPVYYGHDNLGCAECHMTSTNKHSFGVVDKDAITGAITAIASQKCVECHDGEHALFVAASQVGQTLNIWDGAAAVPTVVTQQMADDAALLMEEEAEGYHEAIAILGGLLTTAGTPPQLAYPYFSGTPTDQGQAGAMYNYSFLHHEPGAYAHNRFMAKRMLFDSIDWMDNRTLDGSITIDDVTYPEAALWFGATLGVATRP